jgi:hypothetical protein
LERRNIADVAVRVFAVRWAIVRRLGPWLLADWAMRYRINVLGLESFHAMTFLWLEAGLVRQRVGKFLRKGCYVRLDVGRESLLETGPVTVDPRAVGISWTEESVGIGLWDHNVSTTILTGMFFGLTR